MLKNKTTILLKSYLLLTFGIIISLYSKGQSYSPIIFDKQQSQYFGVYNLTTLHQVLYSFEDKHIRDTLFRENNFLKKTAGFGYRMTKLSLLDAYIDVFILLLQHEEFGHGSRMMEFGYKDFSVSINSGFTHWGTLRPGYKNLNIQQYLTVSIGGVDANMLLANNLTSQMLLNDTLHYRQGLLFLEAQNDLIGYLWLTRYAKPENIRPGNDMVSFIEDVNDLYAKAGGEVYNIKKLLNQSLISFANPIQIYSAFSILYTYGIKGQKQLNKIPMIKFGNVRYLPAFNYSLTPFGSQYHFVNYIRYKRMLLSGDFNLGDNTFNTFYGVSLKGFNIVDRKRIALNVHLDIWNQPELELDSYRTPNTTNKIGEAFKMDLMLRPFISENKLGIFVQAGYKTKGYIMGEALAESFILRYGISLHL